MLSSDSKKFVSACPPPSGYDAEILIVIDEELHEISEAVCRVLESEPTEEGCREIALEVGDLYETVRRAVEAGTIPTCGNTGVAEENLGDEGGRLIRLLLVSALAGQRLCKALRFGLEETQPGQPHNNATRL
jgi:hypothetical protein